MAPKTIAKPHTNPRLLSYIKRQPLPHGSLQDVQKSLSAIGISLSKRVTEDREKR